MKRLILSLFCASLALTAVGQPAAGGKLNGGTTTGGSSGAVTNFGVTVGGGLLQASTNGTVTTIVLPTSSVFGPSNTWNGTFVGNGAGITNIATGSNQTIWVSMNGSDSASGSLIDPLRTLAAAKTKAASGQTIVVTPGNYTNNNLLKAGVNWYFYPGAKVTYYRPRSSDSFGLFDDRATGSTTNIIAGAGVFYLNSFTNFEGKGLLVTTNSGTRIYMEADQILYNSFIQGNFGIESQGAVHVANCAEVFIKANTVWSPGYTNYIEEGEDEFGPIQIPESSIGMYWGLGTLNMHIGRLGPTPRYAIKALHPAERTQTNTLHLTAQRIIGDLLITSPDSTAADNPNWQTFINVDYLQGKCSYYGTGEHFLSGGHVIYEDGAPALTLGNGEVSSTNCTLHVNLQKLTTTDDFCVQNTNTTLYMNVDYYVGVPVKSGPQIGTLQHGNIVTCAGGKAVVSGKYAKIMRGCAVNGAYANVILSDLVVDNSTSTVNIGFGHGVIMKVGSTVRAKNCTFICPPGGNPFYSEINSTVAVDNCYGNNTNSSTITLSPNNGFWANGDFSTKSITADGFGLTNAVDLAPGSGISITTNASKRLFTIASTAGGTTVVASNSESVYWSSTQWPADYWVMDANTRVGTNVMIKYTAATEGVYTLQFYASITATNTQGAHDSYPQAYLYYQNNNYGTNDVIRLYTLNDGSASSAFPGIQFYTSADNYNTFGSGNVNFWLKAGQSLTVSNTHIQSVNPGDVNEYIKSSYQLIKY